MHLTKIKFIVFLFGILCFYISDRLHAAIDLTGIGTRAQSLGGNFRAVADDYSAMFWNPAGMVFQNGWRTGFNFTLVSQSSSYLAADSPIYQEKMSTVPISAPSDTFAGLKQFSATFPYTTRSSVPVVFVPSAGIFHSNGQIAFGFGVWAAFGIRARYDLIGTSNYSASLNFFKGEDWKDDMKFIDIHPTVAYRLSDQWAVGVGLSFVIADIYLRKPAFSPMNPYLNEEKYNQLYLEYVQTLPEENRLVLIRALNEMKESPKDHLLADTYITGSGYGLGGNIGLLFKVTETFRMGASVQYYADIPLSGELTIHTYFPYQADIQKFMVDTVILNNVRYEGLLNYYERMKKNNIIDLPAQILLSEFGSGNIDIMRSKEQIHASMSLPIRAGIGICYTGIPHMMFSADIGWTSWSAWDEFIIKDKNGNQISTIEKNWRDVIRMGAGIEYDWTIFKCHGGFYTESRAAINTTMVPTNPDVNRRNVLSLGAEIPMGRYTFNINFEKTFMNDLNIEKWVIMPNRLDYKNMAGYYSSSMTNVMFGIDLDI